MRSSSNLLFMNLLLAMNIFVFSTASCAALTPPLRFGDLLCMALADRRWRRLQQRLLRHRPLQPLPCRPAPSVWSSSCALVERGHRRCSLRLRRPYPRLGLRILLDVAVPGCSMAAAGAGRRDVSAGFDSREERRAEGRSRSRDDGHDTHTHAASKKLNPK